MNRQLKKYIRLGSRIALYVPGTVNINEASNNDAWIAKTSLMFSDLFGGATATPGAGYWVDDTAGLVSENVTIVYSYATDEALKTGIHKVLQFAHEMKSELNQSAVSLEVNGELYLI